MALKPKKHTQKEDWCSRSWEVNLNFLFLLNLTFFFFFFDFIQAFLLNKSRKPIYPSIKSDDHIYD